MKKSHPVHFIHVREMCRSARYRDALRVIGEGSLPGLVLFSVSEEISDREL